MKARFADKVTQLPNAGIVASVGVGASIGWNVAASTLWLDGGLVTPALALMGIAATGIYLARTPAQSGPSRRTLGAVLALVALAVIAAVLTNTAVPEISLASTSVALGALALTGSKHARATAVMAAIYAAAALHTLGFAKSELAAPLADAADAIHVAAWAYAIGNLTLAVFLARAYGIVLGGNGAKNIRWPLAIVIGAYAIPLWVTYTVPRYVGGGLLRELLTLSLITAIVGCALAMRVTQIGPELMIRTTLVAISTISLCLTAFAFRDERAFALAIAGILTLMAFAIAGAMRLRRRFTRAPLLQVSPATFTRVAFPVPIGTSGPIAVGPIPPATSDDASDVAVALRAGQAVVLDGDRTAARRIAASVASAWQRGDSLVVWTSGDSQDRIDTGLARGVEAVLQAGGATGAISETLGAARLAYRYLRNFPGPVLVVVDGWSAGAAERLSPAQWHGAVSLLILGGTFPGALVVHPTGGEFGTDGDGLPVLAPKGLEAAILAGAPQTSLKVLRLIATDPEWESSLSAHLDAGVARACSGGTAICVREDLAERHVAARQADGSLATEVLSVLERVAAHLPDHGDHWDPRSAMRDLADAGVALWERGREALDATSMERAALAMHRVVIALEQSGDQQRAHRLAKDVETFVTAFPAIAMDVTLQSRVDVVATMPISSLPPQIAESWRLLAAECQTVLGVNHVTTCRAELGWLIGTWTSRPRAAVMDQAESVARRLESLLDPAAPLPLVARQWASNVGSLLKSSRFSPEDELERVRVLEARLPVPSTALSEAYASLGVALGGAGRHDEAQLLAKHAETLIVAGYGHLFRSRGDALTAQLSVEPDAEVALMKGIEVYPIVELTLPWTMSASLTPMKWVELLRSRREHTLARALLESVGEHLEHACPPGSPVHDAYLKALGSTSQHAI